MFKFPLSEAPRWSWWQRLCARVVAKMIWKHGTDYYEFNEDFGKAIDASKSQLVHWILVEAGYSCSVGSIEEVSSGN